MVEEKEVRLMVKRDKVVDPRGRSWISGKLGSDEYFSQASRAARKEAERAVAARIQQQRPRRLAG